MNDDTDKPLNPVGDAALEARITAWVLGEASPFEAAELEEICARDPEARLFERRLRVLHGFITGDRKAGPEDEWKLPAEKRAKIEALFDEGPVVLAEEDREPEKVGIRYMRKPAPPRQTGRRALLALAACTVISAAGWMLFSSVGSSSHEALAMREKGAMPRATSAKNRQAAVDELRKAVIAQEDAVEDKRKLLAQIARTEGVTNSEGRRYTADNAVSATEAYAQLEQEKLQIESQVESLQRYDGSQLMNYAAGLSLPDDKLAAQVPKFQEAKRQLDGMKSQGVAENHPDFRAKATEVASLEKDVADSVTSAREALKAKLELSKEQLARLDQRMDAKEEDAVSQGIASQSYSDVKNDFESSQRQLESLKQKLIAEESRMNLSDDALAMAPTFAAGGGGGGSGGGFGGGVPAPATPAAPAKPMGGPMPPPTAAPATSLDSLAAVESKSDRGQVMDESLAELAEEPATRRSKSSVNGPLAKKPALSVEDRSGLPMPETAPAAATAETATATGAIALHDFAKQGTYGLDTLGDRGGQPADSYWGENMDADQSDRFALSFSSGAPSQPQFDIQARFRGEASTADTNGRLGGNYHYADNSTATFGGERPMDPSLAAGVRSGLANRDHALGTMPQQEGAASTPPNIVGAWQSWGDAPAEPANLLTDATKGGLKQDLTREINGSVAPGSAFFDVEAAGKKEQAQQAFNANAADKDSWFGRLEESKELADAEVAKSKGDNTSAANTSEFKRSLTADGAVEGKPADAPVVPMREEAEAEFFSRAGAAGTPVELLPKLEKAIQEGEKKLQDDPNSLEIQDQLNALSKVREDLRNKIDVDAKGGKEVQEQNKAPLPIPLIETLTSAEPFSTFSLHVSDASFKMAKAALDRGEVPVADGIRPEEFYNAFDFGDPAPANGEPVVCAVEQSAHPALPQRNLLRIGVKTGSQGRAGSTPLNLTLLLDSSGSMEREDRNAGLANAIQQLSGLLKEGDTVSVVGFARQPRLLVDRLPGNRAQELNAIFAQTPSEGGTNLEEGIKLGEELALRQFNPAAQNRIVLFTDGAANLGDAKPETLQAKVEQMRQKGIAFDAAGFGTDGLNDKLLERLTRNGNGRYYIVDRAEDADANFGKQLAGAFRPAAENVKVQVRFNPARVAKYKLIGFEEHRLKKEDFRNDAVDAAEMAAEEAGNALYQIEALPQGEGEVGEVSVRFRDAASGQMVERTWTIPYEAQATSFDQATPSIQLAGLAAFAAEKLRGAPMADAVDFQQLAPVMAKVKARYASSKPVAELEAMIGKLK
jgi:hypothetical protein